MKINWLSINFINTRLENLYSTYVSLENKILIKLSCLFLILTYLIITIIGFILANPKLYLIFAVNSILNIFLLFSFLRTKNDFKIIFLIKYFSSIFSFNLLHIISIYSDFSYSRIRMVYLLIFIRNFLYILMFKTNFIIVVFPTIISIMTIIFYVLPYEKNKINSITDIITELIIFYISFSVKKYYEIISRKKFIELIELKKLNNYFYDFIDNLKDLHFIIFENKIIYINKILKDLLDKKYFEKKLVLKKENLDSVIFSDLNTITSKYLIDSKIIFN